VISNAIGLGIFPVNFSICDFLNQVDRFGDHIWWISDLTRFRTHFPEWQFTHNMEEIMQTVIDGLTERLQL
jgi:CDP-paratose 2-epimerase